METSIFHYAILAIALFCIIELELIRRSTAMSTAPVTRDQLDQLLVTQNATLAQVVSALAALAAQDAQTIKDLESAIASGRGDYTSEFNTIKANNATLQTALAAIQGETAADKAADVVPVVPTTTTLTGPATGAAGSPLVFSGTVAQTTPASPVVVPTGTVKLADAANAAVTGSATLDASGDFTITLSGGLPAGTYSVTADYGGDAANAPSASAALTVVVS